MPCPILALAKQLIKRPSLTPEDAGCQEIIIARLRAFGFSVHSMDFGKTLNFWAWRGKGCTLAFAGHTDVVPSGDAQCWHSPPFEPVLRNDMLYGRGAADMKGALAAMVIAAERFISQYPQHQGRLGFLITSDEEGSAIDGMAKVVEILMARQERLDYCLVGEPSSHLQLGDIVKNGRRGSLTANLLIEGIQGHVGYPYFADNPIHRAIPVLNELLATKWDHGNAFFSPTTMQITNVHAGTNASNIIPGELKVQFNFRFSTELTDKIIRQRVNKLMRARGLRYHINWFLSGHPFLTPRGKLLDAVVQTIECYQNITPCLETSGGTSDGRFIARMGAQVVELGPVNSTIHKVDECVSITDLQLLSRMYQRIMELLVL